MQIFGKKKVNKNQKIYILGSMIFFLRFFCHFSTIELENVGKMCFFKGKFTQLQKINVFCSLNITELGKEKKTRD
jgi:hypothetical protein